MYGYIYKTTNLTNNKIYIGQKHSDKFLAEKYLGSGKLLKAAVKKYGKETFIVELLDTAETAEELDKKEIYWIAELNSTDHTIGYNICEGGAVNRTMVGENNPFYGKTHTAELKQKISQQNSAWWNSPLNKEKHSQSVKDGMQQWWNSLSETEQQDRKEAWSVQNGGENNPMYGRHHTKETKNLISQRRIAYLANLSDNWIDPAQTPEAKAKRSNSLKGHTVSEETRQKLREFNQNHCWVCIQRDNFIEKKQILKDDIQNYLLLGYQLGKKWRVI